MLRSLLTMFSALALAGLPAAHAQAPQPPAPPPPPQAQAPDLGQTQVEVDETDLETFADIYVELEEMIGRYEGQMADVETQEEAQEIQDRMQTESFELIAEHEWTPQHYNAVVEAVNADQELLQKALELIEERRS